MQCPFIIPRFLLSAPNSDPPHSTNPYSISKPPPNPTNPPVSNTQQATPELRKKRPTRKG